MSIVDPCGRPIRQQISDISKPVYPASVIWQQAHLILQTLKNLCKLLDGSRTRYTAQLLGLLEKLIVDVLGSADEVYLCSSTCVA